MEPRLKRLDSGGLVGVIRKDLNSPLAVPENRCGGCFPLALFDRCAGCTIPREGTRRAAVGACTPRCIRPRRRSARLPGTRYLALREFMSTYEAPVLSEFHLSALPLPDTSPGGGPPGPRHLGDHEAVLYEEGHRPAPGNHGRIRTAEEKRYKKAKSKSNDFANRYINTFQRTCTAPRGDSNPHAQRQQFGKLLCIPVPPRGDLGKPSLYKYRKLLYESHSSF